MALPEPSSSSTALVTGASSGIGEAIARELASRGQGVTLVARREERLRELAAELSDEHGVRAETIGADLSDAAARERMANEIDGLGLAVEILVNNAGFGAYGDFAHIERAPQVEMVRINVEAVVDLAARYLPGMVERGRGTLINVASTAAFQPMPGGATYAASKAFVLSHSDALHEEVKASGVTVTAVCPGPVRTEFTQVAGIGESEETTPGALWMSAEETAEQAVKAAERGRRVVVPGMINQAGAFFGQHSPRMLALPIVKRIWGRAV
jgi:uncharacterized protein